MKKIRFKIGGKINWGDHLVNLLVVVIGVTIAFQLSEYNEGIKNKKLKGEFYKSFVSDLEKDIELMDTLIKANDIAIKYNYNMIRAIRTQDLENDSLFMWINTLRYMLPFKPQSTTYESLKASGNIEVIDFSTRNKIIDLYEQFYDGGMLFDDYHSGIIEGYTLPYIINELKMFENGKLDPAFLKDNRFQNMMYSQVYIAQRKNNFYREMRIEAQNLKDQLALAP